MNKATGKWELTLKQKGAELLRERCKTRSRSQITLFCLLTMPAGQAKEERLSRNFSALKNGEVATPYKSQPAR